MLFNKKGSLEISIQAIVIVVLAMTILGLGIGFTKSIFQKITGSTEDISDQVRQKVVEDLVQGDKRLSFPKTEVIVERGSSSVLTIGIMNKEDTKLVYTLTFTLKRSPAGATGTPENWFQFDKTRAYELSATKSDVRNVRLQVPSDAKEGSYFYLFEIKDATGATYAQSDFFVVVR